LKSIILGLAIVTTCAMGSAIHAQPLFAPPGDIRLTPLLTTFSEENFVGLDGDGFAYSTSSNSGMWWNLTWWRPEQLSTGVIGTLALPNASGGSMTVMDRAGTGVWVLQSAVDPNDPEAYGFTLHHFRAADHAPGSIVESLPSVGFYSNDTFPLFARHDWTTRIRTTPDGSLCAWFAVGLYCLDPAIPGPDGVRVVAATTAFDAGLPFDPGWEQYVLLGDERRGERQGWRVLDVAGAPDGRFLALVTNGWIGPESSPGVRASFTLIWLAAVAADGTVTARFGPFPYLGEVMTPGSSNPSGAFGPLHDARTLMYEPELDAIVVPVQGQDLGWFYETEQYSHLKGHGLQVFPLDRPGRGYLSLTYPLGLVQAARPPHQGGAPYALMYDLMRTADDRLALMVDHPGAPIANPRSLQLLEYDAAALDLDMDLLSAAEEAALGTSDYLADTDGSGTLDGIEVHLAGTDPTLWSDDPALAVEHVGDVTYSTSGLIAAVLPPGVASAAPALGPGGPLCLGGRCYAPGGGVITSFPNINQSSDPLHWPVPIVAANGRFVMTWNYDGLTRTWFDDGRRELYLPQSVITAVAEGIRESQLSPWQPWPIDEELTFFTGGPDSGIIGPSQVITCFNTDCRITFDIATPRCDSGLGPCQIGATFGTSVHDLTNPSFAVLGWDPTTERLHVRVKGLQDGWLLGIHPTEPPIVIERAATMAGMNSSIIRTAPAFDGQPWARFPDWQVKLPNGDFLTDNGLVTPYRSYLRTAFDVTSWLAPVPIWNDTLFVAGDELVRLEHRLDPGDIVMVRVNFNGVPVSGDYGVMLYKSGARGGLAKLWNSNQTSIRDPGDIDVTADGRLCVPDRGRGQLWLYEASDPALRVPDIAAQSTPVPGAVACLFDGDDVLVLTRNPVALKRFNPTTGTLVDEAAPTVNGEPLELMRTPSGALEVLGTGDNLRGKAYTSDGAAITMNTNDTTLRFAAGVGTPEAAVDIRKLVYINLEAPPEPTWPARVRIVARPDGFVFVVPYDAAYYSPTMSITRLYAIDPGRSRVLVAGPNDLDASSGAGLAVVPGGSTASPWRSVYTVGEREKVPGPGGGTPVETPDPEPPDAPAPPEGGREIDTDDPACHGGGAGKVGLWLACSWLLLQGLRRRIRC
jgi:hypothetical protein